MLEFLKILLLGKKIQPIWSISYAIYLYIYERRALLYRLAEVPCVAHEICLKIEFRKKNFNFFILCYPQVLKDNPPSPVTTTLSL